MTDKELKNWIFAWAKDVKGTPLDSEINDLIWMVDAYLAPMIQKVDLETLKRVHPIRDRANGVYSSASYEVDGYNRAIDDIKSKYGDLYVGVK